MANKKKKVHFVTNKATGKRTGFMPRPNSQLESDAQLKEAVNFFWAEFRAKHGDSKVPEIAIERRNGVIEVRAKNY